jgi:hypothetical protein
VGDSYFAVGTQGTVLTSPDGVAWSSVGTITGKSLYGAATQEGRLVLVGVEGVILRSQITSSTSLVNFVKYPMNASENLFLFAGEPDQRFALDRSTNLVNWLNGPTLEIKDPNGTLIYQDTGTNAPFIQFYRTRNVP